MLGSNLANWFLVIRYNNLRYCTKYECIWTNSILANEFWNMGHSPTYRNWWSHTNLLAIFVPATTHLTWLCHGRARRNVVNELFNELPRLSGMSYLSPFDHLPPFWVSVQGWRHTYSIKHLIPDSMFITPWCKLDERFWTFMIKSAIQVNTLHYITLHRKNLNTVFYAG